MPDSSLVASSLLEQLIGAEVNARHATTSYM
jgi:hypothetical protein